MKHRAVPMREARSGRGNLLRPDLPESRDYAGRVFAEPCDLSGEALAKTEARNAIHPCGKPQDFLAEKDKCP